MSSEEAFAISWKQLPQRDCWRANDNLAEQDQDTSNVVHRKFNLKQCENPIALQSGGWEYLDHTADVQIHSWGIDMSEAYGAAVVAMSGYMVELGDIPGNLQAEVHIQGHDEQSLLFNLMDECLYVFHTEQFVTKRVIVQSLDTFTWEIKATLQGGSFDSSRHSQGTEVKAITYSNMQIVKKPGSVEAFVIVDI
ncbi:Protein archease-like [Gracilariopsis chorda]|uniref:Protein archease-like n=1 Tax=Gracilariopsis chorda TaxID=448386 RepID=A0A2V3IP05_9FLOR|nr:Protein archease-like [Gracilariopsis chorda]|eukprot:PXF43793.1 Protein archease-like [Gracilariopsis chorda]